MLKKTIKYKDFNDNEVSEDFYFNLTLAELAEMEMVEGITSIRDHLIDLTKSGEADKILRIFKMIISSCVGRKSEDGKRFIKNPQITEEFMQSNAYSVLFMSFLKDSNNMVDFMRGVIPSDVHAMVDAKVASGEIQNPFEFKTRDPELMSLRSPAEPAELVKAPEEYTRTELMAMTDAEFDAVVGTDPSKMSRAILVVAMIRRNNRPL